jgi:hypothetical protein
MMKLTTSPARTAYQAGRRTIPSNKRIGMKPTTKERNRLFATGVSGWQNMNLQGMTVASMSIGMTNPTVFLKMLHYNVTETL